MEFHVSLVQGLSQAVPSLHCSWNCPLGEKLEWKHAWQDLAQYRNCKLKQNVESVFYRTLSIQSSFSSHVSVMLYWIRMFPAQKVLQRYARVQGARCKHDNLYIQVFVYLSVSHLWEENDCSTGKKENLTLSTFWLSSHFLDTRYFQGVCCKWADLCGKNIVVLIHREACVNMANLM